MKSIWCCILLSFVLACHQGPDKPAQPPADPPTPPLAPTISVLSPRSILEGEAPFTLTVSGSHYFTDSVIQWNGSPRATFFVSASQLQASIPAQDAATSGTALITVLNPGAEGGISSSASLVIDPLPPTPILATLDPQTIQAGGPSFQLTLGGSHFFADSIVQWNGAARLTTFVSGTQLQASISDVDIATASTAVLTVSNPRAEGGVSGPVSFQISAPPPMPAISLLSPLSVYAGGPDFRLTVSGSHFSDTSTIQWNGSPVITTFIRDNELWGDIPASLISAARVATITVQNPGAAPSAPVSLPILAPPPAPTITDLTPGTVTVGSAAFTLVVNGSRFTTDSVVQWNGISKYTAFISTTQLQAYIPVGDLTAACTAAVTVINPLSEGGPSAPAAFSIDAPAPVASSFAPPSAVAGSTPFTLTVTGNNFFRDSSVYWNGSARSTNYLSPTQLEATITAQDIASQGSAQITVVSPASEGGSSGALAFAITAVPVAPVLTFLSPMTSCLSGHDFTLTVNGSGFFPDSVVEWNGIPRTTTYVSPRQVQAGIRSQDLGTAGLAQVTLRNPTAEGGPSGPLPFTISPISIPAPELGALRPRVAEEGTPGLLVTVGGIWFTSNSVVLWNGQPRTTTYLSDLKLQVTLTSTDLAGAGSAKISVQNPMAEGGTSSPMPFTVSDLKRTVVNLLANDILLDPARQVVYATLPGSAGARANQLLVLNPATGSITASVIAGSEPNRLALSDDGKYLYVGLDGENAVERFLLPSLIKDLSIPLGSVPLYGSAVAADIQVAPGAPHTIAVSLGVPNMAPFVLGGVAIFDDATARFRRAEGYPFDSLQWGADATHLYAADAETSAFSYYILDVDAKGVNLVKEVPVAFSNYRNAIHFDGASLIFGDAGQVLNASNGHPAGAFSAFGELGPMTTDAAGGLAFFLRGRPQDETFNLTAFSLDHFTPIRTEPIPQVHAMNGFPSPTRMQRWGSDGLVMGGGGGPLYLVSGPLIRGQARMAFQSRPAISSLNPQAVPAGSPSVTVTLNGTGFVPGSIVQWNGSARATTFVSSGQLQATIPASDLADPASVLVTVLNAPADGGLSASIPFTVDKVLTLIADLPANDIAWDPTRDLIYASLPGSAGASGNSIVTLDPATGAITSSVFIGSEPNRLAVSGNGQFLYVGVDGSSTLQRYTLPAMTQDLSIDLGSDPISGPYMAFDLQVEPGAPHTVAVSLGCAYSATSSGGAFIYDDATARPGSASGRLGAFFNSLQWGPDGTKLYATNAATSSWDYYILSVNAGGVSLVYDLPGAFTSYQNALLYDGTSHMLYSSSGLVLSPATGQVAGNFLVSGPLALDPAKVYFLNVDLDPSVLTIQSFDPVAHTPIATATVIPAPSTPLSFTPRRLLRRGPNGLVMGGGGTPIYFVSGPFAQ